MNMKDSLLMLSVLAATPAFAASVTQTNLTSDGAVAAAFTDPNLKNPWGISYSPTGAFWVSDNATGLTTLYDGTGAIQPLVVTIPPASGTGIGSPTGQVFNGGSGFVVTEGANSAAANFLFATEDGTISGWSFSVDQGQAIIAVNRSTVGLGAVYKGLAIYTDKAGRNYLLATDFRNNEIDVFGADFTLRAAFRDSAMPADFAPYNVQVLNGGIYVTYAKQDKAKHDSVSGRGLGAVERIDFNGTVRERFMGGKLNAPWGLAIAPAGWGALSGHLLVGNFGDGRITSFNSHLQQRTQLKTAGGKPLSIQGLWGLIPGNGSGAGSTSEIYFAAGTHQEADGLFGSLTYAP